MTRRECFECFLLALAVIALGFVMIWTVNGVAPALGALPKHAKPSQHVNKRWVCPEPSPGSHASIDLRSCMLWLP